MGKYHLWYETVNENEEHSSWCWCRLKARQGEKFLASFRFTSDSMNGGVKYFWKEE